MTSADGQGVYLTHGEYAAMASRIETLEAENARLREAGEVLFDAVRPLNGVNGFDLPLTTAMFGWRAALKGDSYDG